MAVVTSLSIIFCSCLVQVQARFLVILVSLLPCVAGGFRERVSGGGAAIFRRGRTRLFTNQLTASLPRQITRARNPASCADYAFAGRNLHRMFQPHP